MAGTMDNNRYYTGVGSRNAPERFLTAAEVIGYHLAKEGFVGRSGKADGMDQAFLKGAIRAAKENPTLEHRFVNYLPWLDFNKTAMFEDGNLYLDLLIGGQVYSEAVKICKEIVGDSAWDNVSDGIRRLWTRTVFQVLGSDLRTPSEFIILYAPPSTLGHVKGGTDIAVQVANLFGVRWINLNSKWLARAFFKSRGWLWSM